MKNFVLSLGLSCSVLLSITAEADKLTTPNYSITITENCVPAELLCKDVTYIGINKKTRKKLELKGQTTVRYCPGDNTTPCQQVGYAFLNGDYMYEVFLHGLLRVSNKGKTLVEESGEWVFEK